MIGPRPRNPDRVFIVGKDIKDYARLFMDSKIGSYVGVRDINDADIVVFTGGEDVDPQLYGERQLKNTFIRPSRDLIDQAAWAASEGKLRIGICRGAQFLNVMCGGTLWQDVDGHRGAHAITDRITGARLFATSTHHQMMRPAKDGRIIATAMEASRKHSDGRDWERIFSTDKISNIAFLDGDVSDPEVIMYDKQACLCFQPHPEMPSATDALKKYFFQQISILKIRASKTKGIV